MVKIDKIGLQTFRRFSRHELRIWESQIWEQRVLSVGKLFKAMPFAMWVLFGNEKPESKVAFLPPSNCLSENGQRSPKNNLAWPYANHEFCYNKSNRPQSINISDFPSWYGNQNWFSGGSRKCIVWVENIRLGSLLYGRSLHEKSLAKPSHKVQRDSKLAFGAWPLKTKKRHIN